jgi:hypothetical protein
LRAERGEPKPADDPPQSKPGSTSSDSLGVWAVLEAAVELAELPAGAALLAEELATVM